MKRPPHRFIAVGFAVAAVLPLGEAFGQGGRERFIIEARNPAALSNNDLEAAAVGAADGVTYQRLDRPGFGVNLIAREMLPDDAAALEQSRPDLIVELDRRLVTNANPGGGGGGVLPWSPDRIDQRLGNDGVYLPNYLEPCAGYRPYVYVCDTGVFAGHDEFVTAAGRLEFVGTYIPALLNRTIPALQDPWDHGTAVAACAVGQLTGSGRCPANIVSAVCYPDPGVGGGGTFASFAADVIYWSMNEHLLRGIDADPYNDASVLIFASSTQGGPSRILDLAVERARLAGMVVIASAGNQNFDAVNTSPAGAVSQMHGDITLTVAASTIADARWAMSNYGPLVELFAPGDNVLCASTLGAPNLCALRNGTSFSAGYVGGAAARILAENPWATPAEVGNLLTDQTDPIFGPSGPFGQGVNAVPKLLYVNPGQVPAVLLTYDQWVAIHLPEPPGPEDDADGDGRSNALEYFMALDPNRCDASEKHPAACLVSGNLEYRFRSAKFLSKTTMAEVQISPDFINWTPVEPSFIVDDDTAPCVPEATWKLASVPIAGDRFYVRLAILGL